MSDARPPGLTRRDQQPVTPRDVQNRQRTHQDARPPSLSRSESGRRWDDRGQAVSQNLSRFIQHTKDPEATEAKVHTASYLNEMFGLDQQFVVNNYRSVIRAYTGEDLAPQSGLQAIKQAWQRGMLMNEIGLLEWELMSGNDDPAIHARLEELSEQVPPEGEIQRSLPVRAVKAAAEMAPMMLEGAAAGARRGGAAAAGAAGAAAIAGQLGPQALAPEEIFTVPGAAGAMMLAGMASGKAEYAAKVEGGLAYRELRNFTDENGNPINPRITRATASGVGFINGALELLQVGSLPGVKQLLSKVSSQVIRRAVTGKSLGEIALRSAARYGSSIGKETAQEIAQESTNILAEEIAKELTNRADDTDFEAAELQEVAGRLKEVAGQSALAFSVMGIPGSATGLIADVQRRRGDTPDPERARQARERAYREPVDPEEERPVDDLSREFEERVSRVKSEGNLTEEEYRHLSRLADEIDYRSSQERERSRPEQKTAPHHMTRAEWEAAGRPEPEDPGFAAAVDSTRLRDTIAEASPGMSRQEIDGVALLAQMRAERMDMTVDEWADRYLQPEMAVRDEERGGRLQQSQKGAVTFAEDGRALIRVSQRADFSTWVHELSHIFRRQMDPDTLRIAEDAFGVTDGNWTTDKEEAFAVGFEDWLRTRKSPAPETDGIFQQMGQWLERIYRTLKARIQFSPDIERVYSDLITPASALDQQARARGEIIGSKPRQPASTLDEVYEKVGAARGEFDTWAQNMASELGASQVKSRDTLKGRDRAQQKIDSGDAPSELFDIDGKTFIFDDPNQLLSAIDTLAARPEVKRVKNRYARPITTGYRDVLMNVEMPNGAIVELQLNTPQMMSAKDEVGHVLYEVYRELQSIEVSTPQLERERERITDQLLEAQRNVYSAAWDAASRSNASFSASDLDIGTELSSISAALDPEATSFSLSDKTRNAWSGFIEDWNRKGLSSYSPYETRGTDTTSTDSVIEDQPERNSTTSLTDYPVQEVPIDEIALSEDVPNFKEGANEQGVIEPIESEQYQRLGTAPIVLWERSDGRREVITGRHRLDLARRTGEKTIPAQIVREDAGFTREQAMTFDAEANIRDGQGEISDYANYFRNSDITQEEASGRGLLSRDKGRKGFAIGRYAGDALYSLYRNDQISASKASSIAQGAANQDAVQQAAMSRHKQLDADSLYHFAVQLSNSNMSSDPAQMDMFGNDDSAIQEAEQMATHVAGKIRQKAREANALQSALRLSKGRRAEVVQQYGFEVGDTDAVAERISALANEMERLENWTTDPELYAQVRRDLGLEVDEDQVAVATTEPEFVEQEETLFQVTENESQVLKEVRREFEDSVEGADAAQQAEIDRMFAALQGQTIEQRRKETAREIERQRALLSELGEKGLLLRDVRDPSQYAILHRSSREGVEWQLSRFDSQGPYADERYADLRDMLTRVLEEEMPWYRVERTMGARINRPENNPRTLYQTDAWHGSPHNFDRFSTEAMGTGEGGQAFGWGLYFTDSEAIARHYAQMGEREAPTVRIRGEAVDPESFLGVNASFMMEQVRDGVPFAEAKQERLDTLQFRLDKIEQERARLEEDRAEYRALQQRVDEMTEARRRGEEATPEGQREIDRNADRMRQLDDRYGGDIDDSVQMEMEAVVDTQDPEEIRAAIRELEGLKEADIEAGRRNLYRVRIHAGRDENWLDWYEPIPQETSKRVADQLRKEGAADDALADFGVESTEELISALDWDITGQEVYQTLGDIIPGEGTPRATKKDVSLFLRRAGIDGIRYPAGTLSSARSDAMNYVVFDEDAVQIEEQTLYQQQEDGHERDTRESVQRGDWVRESVLEEYSDRQWAQDEKEHRERLRKEARAEDDVEDFIAFQQAMSLEEHPREYLEEIYHSAHEQPVDRATANRRFVESLTKESLSAALADMAAMDRQGDTNLEALHPIIKSGAQRAVKGQALSDAHYKKIMDQIRDDPQQYRELWAAAFADEEEIRQLQAEAEQAVDLTAEEKLREENRQLRREVKGKEESVDQALRRMRVEERRAKQYEQAYTKQGKELSETKKELRKYQNRVTARDALRRERAKRKLRDEVNGLIRTIMRPPSKGLNYDEQRQIAEIQAGLEARGTQRKERLRKVLNEQKEELSLPFQRIIEEELNKRYLKDMSLRELQDLATRIEGIREQGRNKLWLKKLEETALRENAKSAVLREVQGGTRFEKTRAKGSKEADKELKGNAWQKQAALTWNMLRIAEDLGPTAEQWLNTKVNEAVDTEYRNIDRITEPAREKMKELGINSRSLARRIEKRGKTYTVDEVIHMYIAMRNEQSAEALIYGNGLSRDHVNEYIAELSDSEIEWAHHMMDAFGDENFDRLNEVFIQDQNQAMQKVDNYFPIRRQEVTYDTLKEEIADDLLTRKTVKAAYPNKGFTKSRIDIAPKNQPPMRLGATSIFLEQVNKQEHYIAFAMLAKRLQAIFGRRSKFVREAIAQKHGKEWLDTIDDYINQVNNPEEYRAYDAMVKFSNRIRTNVQISALAGNIVSFGNQLAGSPLYLRDAGPWHYLSGIGQFLVNPRKTWQFVEERDPQVKHRSMDPVFNEVSKLKQSGYQSVQRMLATVGMKPIELIDKAMVVSGWKAVYDRARWKDGLSEQEAIRAAQKSTLRTQPSGHGKDMPRMYRDQTMRWFLMFTRSLNQQWNMLTHDMPRDVKQKQIGAAVLEATGLAMAGLAIGLVARKRPQEDEEEVMNDIASQLLVSIPFGTEIDAGFRGRWYAGRGVSILGEPMAETGRLMRELSWNEDTDTDELIDAAIGAGEQILRVTGMPTVAVGRMLDAAREEDLWELVGGPPEDEQ